MTEKEGRQNGQDREYSQVLYNKLVQALNGYPATPQPVEVNPASHYLMSLRSETSRYQMMRKLDKVAMIVGQVSWKSFPWSRLTPEIVSALVTKLAGEYKPAYVNAILAAIRGVVECAFDRGEMNPETYRLIRKVKAVRGGSTEPACQWRSNFPQLRRLNFPHLSC